MARLPPLPADLDEDSQHLYDAMNGEPTLPFVLIGVSSLERAVGSILRGFLTNSNTAKNILDPNGFLGVFANRAQLAYCLGLISKANYENLRILAEIRNDFAHSHVPIDFDDVEIIKKCEKLRLPDLGNSEVPGLMDIVRTNPQAKFQLVVVLTYYRLQLTAIGTERRGEFIGQW